jgi:hypothetical protein
MENLPMSSKVKFKNNIGCFHAPRYGITCKYEVKMTLD